MPNSEVAQSCLTLRDPMDHSPPDSSIHEIFQARVPEWGAIALVFDKYANKLNAENIIFLTNGAGAIAHPWVGRKVILN